VVGVAGDAEVGQGRPGPRPLEHPGVERRLDRDACLHERHLGRQQERRHRARTAMSSGPAPPACHPPTMSTSSAAPASGRWRRTESEPGSASAPGPVGSPWAPDGGCATAAPLPPRRPGPGTGS
jgi:hypothetical protein